MKLLANLGAWLILSWVACALYLLVFLRYLLHRLGVVA